MKKGGKRKNRKFATCLRRKLRVGSKHRTSTVTRSPGPVSLVPLRGLGPTFDPMLGDYSFPRPDRTQNNPSLVVYSVPCHVVDFTSKSGTEGPSGPWGTLTHVVEHL